MTSRAILNGWPIAGGGFASFVPLLPVQIASNRNQMSQVLGGARTTSNQLVFNRRRIVIPAGGVDGEMVFEFSNVYVAQNTTNATETAAAAFTGRLHLEIDGVVKVLTFGGATSKAIAAGALKVKADPITAADFPGVTGIGTQEKVGYIGEERLYAVGATPAFYSATVVHSIPGDSAFSGPSTAPSKIGVPGPATSDGGYTASFAIFGGWTLTARPKVKSPSVLALGASIENYVADNFGDGVDGKGGYVMRAAAKSPVIALSNLSVSGDSWRGYAANSAMRTGVMQYANIIVFAYGGNDFTNGETAAATISRMNAAIASAKSAAPNAKIAVMRPMMKTDSTDGWTTTTGQTPKAGFPEWCAAIDAAAQANAQVDRYITSVRAAVEASPGIAKPNYLLDGTHPTTLGHTAMVDPFRAEIDALAARL